MISVQIRRATRADIAGIVELRLEQMTERGESTDGRDFALRMEHWYFGHGEVKAHWVALAGIEVVGVLSLLDVERTPTPADNDAHVGLLENVFVHEEFRDLGIGSRLINKAMRYARAKGLSHLVTTVDERAASLYSRAGFGDNGELMIFTLDGHFEDF